MFTVHILLLPIFVIHFASYCYSFMAQNDLSCQCAIEKLLTHSLPQAILLVSINLSLIVEQTVSIVS